MTQESAIVIVRQRNIGDFPELTIIGENVRVYSVCDYTPHDRVYEMTLRDDPAVFEQIIPPDSVIGSANDDRHEALSAKILEFVDGTPSLKVIK